MGSNHPQLCGGANLQRVVWVYIVNHYALLHTKYKSYWLHGFIRFLLIFPIITYKEATDMAKLDPKGMVGMNKNFAMY